MADDFIKPDSQLRSLWDQLQNGEITEKQYSEAVSKRSSEIMYEQGISGVAIGSAGMYIPSGSKGEQPGLGKTILEPYAEKGIYSASKITSDTSVDPYGRQDISIEKTNDPTAIGTSRYDANATNLRKFYDENGKVLSASQVASTQTGKAFAAAGWDIGFGPGMIAPGVKADTSERDAYRASKKASQDISSSITQESYNVDPTPLMPSLLQSSVSTTPPPPPAKTAPIDTVLFDDDSVPIEVMTDLIFENIGGQELINIARNDIINGQKISYSPIKNLTSIQQQYNPNNIISLQSTSDKYFANFPIKLDQKIPNVGSGPNGSNVYIEESTGDLIIETVNIENDEQIDIQIAISGTIYEADI